MADPTPTHRRLQTLLVVGLTTLALAGATTSGAARTADRPGLAHGSDLGSDLSSAASSPAGPSASITSTSVTTAPPTCSSVAASLSLGEQVGQLLMVGISSDGMSSAQTRTLSRAHAGSVILLGNTTAGRAAVRRVSDRVHGLSGKPRGVAIMLAVDQEGGTVQRLRGAGFDRIPSARDQAKLSASSLRTKAERWARQLRAAGVDANLAPVADVVPRSLERVNQPVGVLRRGYGPNPDVVAARASAFIAGMHRGHVAAAVKHYPGLGRVRGNTDYVNRVVDRSTTRHDRALKGFAASAAAGVDMVMVSSAVYTRIDDRRRAVFSPVVLKSMLRTDLRYRGMIISDDLTAPGFRDYSVGTRAVTFLLAGGDLLIVGDPAKAPAMVAAVKKHAAADAVFRRDLPHKVTRVLEMKARRGLVSCR